MAFPNTVIQYAEDENLQIQWHPNYLNILTVSGPSSLTTTKPLMHIARSPKYDITDKTWFLRATGFNFTNVSSINNISLSVKMNRGGRISDDTIQLCYQGELIGENQSFPAIGHNGYSSLEPVSIYNGDTSKWQVPEINPSMIMDSSFGIVLRYRSHPNWPHKIAPILYAVELQIS
jgi:hypothetical protein